MKRYLTYLLHAAVLLGVVIAGMKYINGGEFLAALHRFNWLLFPIVAALGVLSVFIKAHRFATVVQEDNDISRWTVVKAYMVGQSATLVPGGIAARAGLLEQVGVPAAKSGPAILLSSLTDQAMFVICTIIAAMFFEQARLVAAIAAGFILLLGALLGFAPTRRAIDRALGWTAEKLRFKKFWDRFRESLACTLSWELVLKGLASTAVSFALLVFALYLCCRGVGVALWIMSALLAFALPTMAGRISGLPGGVGVTEAGMAAIIDAAPGVRLDQAAAAVAVFRVGTILVPAVFGGLLYLLSWKRTVKEECEPEGQPVKAAS